MHNCGHEYWAHCLDCVAGDDVEKIEELNYDGPVCTMARVHYNDGQVVTLVRCADGWVFAPGGGVVLPRYEERRAR